MTGNAQPDGSVLVCSCGRPAISRSHTPACRAGTADGLAPRALAPLEAWRNLDTAVTAFMLGEVDAAAVARAQWDARAAASDCPDAEYWRAEALAARDALHPVAVALLPRLLAPELLAYDDGAPPSITTGERLVALALVGPWLAASTGFAVVATASRGLVAVARWIRP